MIYRRALTSYSKLVLVYVWAMFGLTAFAQVLSVPSGTVGTSSNSNVGIGASNPPYKLTIESGNNSNVFRARAEGDFIFSLAGDGSLGPNLDLFSIRNNNTGIVHVNTLNGAILALGASAGATPGTTEANLVVGSSGNVGIGTTNPLFRFDVRTGIDERLLVRSGRDWGGLNGGVALDARNDAESVSIPFRIRAASINLDSSVGIGTSSPTNKLTVQGVSGGTGISGSDGTGGVRVNFSTGYGVALDAWDGGVPRWGITQFVLNTPTVMIEGQYNTNHVLFNAGGNVGIGTTTPTHKLAVNGTIRAKEIIVDTGWADYVFADDYRLAPLAEVEAHIKEHRHLPGIPSAVEVKEQGVSLGEMQSLLLAKIEELTLHQIEQEKRLRRMEEENRQLRLNLTAALNP